MSVFICDLHSFPTRRSSDLEKSELSASFISQVERDEASPSIASLERITQALGVDLAQLFSREPAEPVVRKQRSEEHTSELQSRGHLVCRLLLEKKKKKETRW